MDTITKDKLPMEESIIETNFKHYLSKIQEKLNQKFKVWGDVQIVQAGRLKLI